MLAASQNMVTKCKAKQSQDWSHLDSGPSIYVAVVITEGEGGVRPPFFSHFFLFPLPSLPPLKNCSLVDSFNDTSTI